MEQLIKVKEFRMVMLHACHLTDKFYETLLKTVCYIGLVKLRIQWYGHG